MGRRRFLGLLGRGAGAVAVLTAGGVTWRAVDQGVFAEERGQAYAAWDDWNPPGDDVLNLVRAAVLAASAHNTQPWLFEITPTRIDLFADLPRNIGTIDPLRRELHLSLGCALENLVLAARPNGKAVEVTALPDPADRTHIARIELRDAPASSSALFEAIPNRHTNRYAYDNRPLTQSTLDTLRGLIDSPGTDVVWFATPGDRRTFGDLTIRATEAITADAQQSADSNAWFRSDWSDLQARKDGPTLDATGQPALTRALAKILPPTTPRQNDEYWLAATRDTQIPTAAAFGTLVVRDPLDVAQRLHAGRTWQRMHLWATSAGLAMQPLNQVAERMDREGTAGLEPTFTTAMNRLLPAGWQPIFSFRAGFPTEDALRSPRRPAEEVLRG
jgi:hypothetical protein